MNNRVRQYLIDKAHERAFKTVSYSEVSRDCKLGLDMSRNDHRDEIGGILFEIFEFEHRNKRPPLTAIVMREGGNEIGFGFYAACEYLGIGNAKILYDRMYAFEAQTDVVNFWKSISNYATYR